VIDGGPAAVYANSLKPRLDQIRSHWKRDDDDKLDIEMLMVSHIDDDHIHGVIDWLNDLAGTDPLPFNIQTLWHNSFDDKIGNASDELRSHLAGLVDEALETGEDRGGMQPQSAAVLASVNQGRKLRSLAKTLAIPLNRGFQGLVCPRESGRTTLNIGAGLKLTVICPTMARLEELSKEWEKTLRKLGTAPPAEIAAFVDRSVANLSSIVVLAEVEGKRMLLTGDARGDHILEGLEGAGLMQGGKIHVDLFKLPHHGSNRNSAPELFERITADHYVVSANGEHENPDPDFIEWIANARAGGKYTIHLTNDAMVDPKTHKDVRQELQAALVAHPDPGRKMVFRKKEALSVRLDLLDPVTY
jgi:hypothetical protein